MRARTFGLILAIVIVSGCTRNEEQIPAVNALASKSDLETLSGARIFFGHQSVGRYLLQGVSELAQQDQSALRVVRVDDVGVVDADPNPGLFHTNIGVNGNPDGKIDAFSQFLSRPNQPAFDVALLKFCYVDLGSDGTSDVQALLDRYAKSVAEIRAAQPNLHLIHVTVPLRADPIGRRTKVKRLLGLSTEEDADNRVRNAFNAGLRKRFAGETIFDIAEVESTLPDGTRSFFKVDGDTVYTLARAYTDDGGHPNAIGRGYVAAAFVHVIAEELRKSATATSAP
jgi:hypothetical protein